MAKNKKEVLIIVRGASISYPKNKFVQKIERSFLRGLTSEVGIADEDYAKMARFFEKNYKNIETLRWDGDIWKNPSISLPIKELDRLIKKYKKSQIDIIAVSLGGLIAQKAISQNKNAKVNKLLYIGAVHGKENHNIKNIGLIFNIYSGRDKVFTLLNDLYNGIEGGVIHGENVVNICLKEIAHEDWCKNLALKDKSLKRMPLFEFYKDLLLKD